MLPTLLRSATRRAIAVPMATGSHGRAVASCVGPRALASCMGPRALCTKTIITTTEEKPLTLTADEMAAFREWQATQKKVSAFVQQLELPMNRQVLPSLDKTAAVFVVAAAATPAVLLVPMWTPLVFLESAISYFSSQGVGPDGLPLWTMRTAFALAGHPAVTLTCGASCALGFALQRSVLNTTGWVTTSPKSLSLPYHAGDLGYHVGLFSALVSPVAVLGAHDLMTMGVMDGVMPRALALDYWAQGGGFASYSYYCLMYLATLPFTAWSASHIGPYVAPALYCTTDGGASRRALVSGAAVFLLVATALSLWMHLDWEYSILQNAPVKVKETESGIVRKGEVSEYDDPTAAMSLGSVGERHTFVSFDVASLSKIPSLRPHAVALSELLAEAQLASAQTTEAIQKLQAARIKEERKYGPRKQRAKQTSDYAVLHQLRDEESDEFDAAKQELRRGVMKALYRGHDHERRIELERFDGLLRAARMPAAGLSRKQLKIVNGALLETGEALRVSEVKPLAPERRMMRRVARLSRHGERWPTVELPGTSSNGTVRL